MKDLVIYTENYVFGGLERFLLDVLERAKGGNITLLINKPNENIVEFAEKNNIRYKYAKISNSDSVIEKICGKRKNAAYKVLNKLFVIARMFDLVYNCFYLKKLLKVGKEGGNLFVINGGYPAAKSCISACLAAKSLGYKRIVMSVLSCPVKRSKFFLLNALESFIDNLLNSSIDQIVPNSTVIKQEMEKYRGFTRAKVKVVYTGIDIPKDVSKISKITVNGVTIEKKEDEVFFGMVSYLTILKGHNYLLDALHLVNENHKNIKCIIVGDGPEMLTLKEQSKKLGLEDKVIFTGHYSGSIYNILRLIDVFVFPSLYEGLPYGVSEAMACRLPVVATSVGGIIEQIEDGVNGYLVEKANSKQLAEKLLNMIKRKIEWVHIGEMNYKKVEKLFTIDAMMKQLNLIFVKGN